MNLFKSNSIKQLFHLSKQPTALSQLPGNILHNHFQNNIAVIIVEVYFHTSSMD